VLINCEAKVGTSSIEAQQASGFDSEAFPVDSGRHFDRSECSETMFVRRDTVGTTQRQRRVAAVTRKSTRSLRR